MAFVPTSLEKETIDEYENNRFSLTSERKHNALTNIQKTHENVFTQKVIYKICYSTTEDD